MAIETLGDWNAILGQCCCEMPACPVPTKECESITKEVCGHSLPVHDDNEPGDECRRFAVKTSHFAETLEYDNGADPADTASRTWTGDHVKTFAVVAGVCENTFTAADDQNEESRNRNEVIGAWEIIVVDATSSASTGVACTVAGTITQTTDYDDPETEDEVLVGDANGVATLCAAEEYFPDNTWTKAGLVYTVNDDPVPVDEFSVETRNLTVTYSGEIDATSHLDAYDFGDHATGAECVAENDCGTLTKVRLRWVVPSDFEGSYFKVTWDEVFFPEGYAPEDPESPQPELVNGDETLEWTGPGDPEVAGSWKTGWHEIKPPAEAGEVRVVNVRFECYRSRFGAKPQVTGEAYEIPT